MRHIASCLIAAAALVATPAAADAPEKLDILKGVKSVVVQTEDGPVEITRVMTDCALNAGWLQPLVPVEGAHPATEIEVLEALNDPDWVVVDMRTIEWRVKATIPGSIHIPYTEVAQRLDELGCARAGQGWDCAKARHVVAFCNGPVCPQSPTALRAMAREGFPPERMHYYRGGMQDWLALGLTTVEGAF
ncbi:rhodanese-like domain-containing protein [Oceanicella actignis]|uniref:rhodanese-like domain-containing protein n=1 Tax=Oceanicella actignis TaxID=1189325 RepID=UPI0011E684C7|nr:rhodanese-like domain-containing protein [Oceanicella actignis]TYO90099.1 rhodanese-related sulfurtransferase [Oceanicella actignis]